MDKAPLKQHQTEQKMTALQHLSNQHSYINLDAVNIQ